CDSMFPVFVSSFTPIFVRQLIHLSRPHLPIQTTRSLCSASTCGESKSSRHRERFGFGFRLCGLKPQILADILWQLVIFAGESSGCQRTRVAEEQSCDYLSNTGWTDNRRNFDRIVQNVTGETGQNAKPIQFILREGAWIRPTTGERLFIFV